mgnify:CR=1 FL=1
MEERGRGMQAGKPHDQIAQRTVNAREPRAKRPLVGPRADGPEAVDGDRMAAGDGGSIINV